MFLCLFIYPCFYVTTVQANTIITLPDILQIIQKQTRNKQTIIYMYRPKEIIIAGRRFKIIYRLIEDYGRFDYERQIIIIRESLNEREVFQTIIHESFHAMLYISGVSFAIDSEKIEEAIIRCFDNFLMPAIESQLNKLINEK